jgi:xanthine/uracil permease
LEMSASEAPLSKPLVAGAVHSVGEVLTVPRLIAFGIPHVLVMYAGAVAAPLTIRAAIKAPREQVAFLITCELLGAHRLLLQSVDVWRFGIRLPVIMGVSIAFGMIPVVSQQFFGQFPHFLGPLLHGGILLASISAVVLNATSIVLAGSPRTGSTRCTRPMGSVGSSRLHMTDLLVVATA